MDKGTAPLPVAKEHQNLKVEACDQEEEIDLDSTDVGKDQLKEDISESEEDDLDNEKDISRNEDDILDKEEDEEDNKESEKEEKNWWELDNE